MTQVSFAETPLLSAEEALPIQVISTSSNQAELSWKIPDQYYLYQHKIEVQQGDQSVTLNLPQAEDLHDDNYGQVKVYYQQLAFKIPTQANQNYKVTWQGCAKDRICYPPQSIQFKTDLSGLVQVESNAAPKKQLTDLVADSEADLNTTSSESTTQDAFQQKSQDTAQDQKWSERLANSPFIYGVLLFFGLGMLLAFTPCSLPMLPILTALIVRDRKGLNAGLIALTFVTSMATVYAVLGLVASSAGLNFQRWLQQPVTLMAFSGLFVLFALNLFGLFEIKLPQAITQRLDRIQSMQKGGSLLSASVMGMLSALLVGPCMTAPLAGALLFISQTQSQWQGAILLFVLGLGMGMPLLLASILGSRVLPRAGEWMNQIKVLFAFIMLALALFFLRPLLSEATLQWLSLALGISFVIYVLSKIFWKRSGLRWLYLACLIVSVPYILYTQYLHSQRFFQQQETSSINWQVAHTANEFNALIAQAPKGQSIVIDVYADWCVACQPIEHRILKDQIVQQALAPFVLIKLDLSQYDQAHQALLNQWEILGPPTYLFLDASHQERRELRLTGAFTKAELLKQLEKLQ
ncbi:protein-disulfide reductase DsbD [Acinetobacter sp. NCu2D-2]|uniref:protein-disulfide reductase DsbD n=1 Tax=Acinetobacter sp. NCu2D-2 TaxID=1608473 RepID=UPI001D0D23C7|nr:protein-disulfide reductase DsbD [Acinetobacter sp. NCu2D-2]